MSKEIFHVVYDGDAFKENEMNAKSLASALIAIAEIFEEADKTLNHGRTKSEINIRASFKTGSFQIDFTNVQSWLQKAGELLIADNVNAVVNGAAIIGIVGSCIKLITFLGKKTIAKIQPLDNKNIQIYRDDEKYIEVEKRVLELYNNLKIRQNLNEAIAKPLQQEGCSEFAIIFNNKISERVTKEEAEYFITPEINSEELSSKEYEHIFSIVSCVFKKDNKWRLFDGNNEINAVISDNSFLNDIENGDISFSKGDRLFCRVKTTQFETASGLKNEYEILEIKKHIKRPEQLSLSPKIV